MFGEGTPACACWRGIFACWRGISRAIELLFFMDSKGNVRRVFLAEMFLAERLRKTRTPAGFVTNPSKQQPQKVPERYLRNALNSWSPAGKILESTCPNVTYGVPEKASLHKENSCSHEIFLAERLRKTRTAARFVPQACKTQARKTLRTLPLESIKNNNSVAREMPFQ